jgi:hypothetical protein
MTMTEIFFNIIKTGDNEFPSRYSTSNDSAHIEQFYKYIGL